MAVDPAAARTREGADPDPAGEPVLDVIYLAATFALFALVGLIAKGAERLVARAGARAPRGEDRS